MIPGFQRKTQNPIKLSLGFQNILDLQQFMVFRRDAKKNLAFL